MSKKSQRPKQKVEHKTYKVKLTQLDIVHLRDLFGILLPPDAKVTVSQALAASQDRPTAEARLWQKIVTLCNEANVPIDEDAPDFIVSMSSSPTLDVFQLACDMPARLSEPPNSRMTKNVLDKICSDAEPPSKPGEDDLEDEDE